MCLFADVYQPEAAASDTCMSTTEQISDWGSVHLQDTTSTDATQAQATEVSGIVNLGLK